MVVPGLTGHLDLANRISPKQYFCDMKQMIHNNTDIIVDIRQFIFSPLLTRLSSILSLFQGYRDLALTAAKSYLDTLS